MEVGRVRRASGAANRHRRGECMGTRRAGENWTRMSRSTTQESSHVGVNAIPIALFCNVQNQPWRRQKIVDAQRRSRPEFAVKACQAYGREYGRQYCATDRERKINTRVLLSVYGRNTRGTRSGRTANIVNFPNAASGDSISSSSNVTNKKTGQIQNASAVLARAGKAFGKLGYFSFWMQLILTIIAAVILTFSVTFSSLGQRTEGAVGLYITAVGLCMAFLSVFWSFGYIRLGQVLRRAAVGMSSSSTGSATPTPPNRNSVMARLKFGLAINMFGFLFTLIGLQSTVGLLVAKTLTTVAANPFLAGASPSFNPVMALDVFLVQATTNVLLSHFLGLLFSLLLLRSCARAAPTASVPA